MSPRQRADIATTMVEEYGVSVRNACRAVRLPRSCYYAPAVTRDDAPVIEKIEAYAAHAAHGLRVRQLNQERRGAPELRVASLVIVSYRLWIQPVDATPRL